MSLVNRPHGTGRPSTSDWYIANTSEPHCGSYVTSEPGACRTHGGTSQPVPGCKRYALLRFRMPLSPSFQRFKQRTMSSLVVPGSRPKKVYGKLLLHAFNCGGK